MNVIEVVYEYSNEVLFGGFQVYNMFPAMGWLSGVMGLDGKLERITRKLDVFLSEIVEEHIEPGEEDFVDLLLALKEEGEDGDFGIANDNINHLYVFFFCFNYLE